MVRRRRCRRSRPHSLNIFSLETTGPIKFKFHMELLWDGGTNVCSNGPGHMTKMATMPIYGKNLKNLLLRDQKATDDRSDKKFLLTSKLCPLGAVCPLPRGYIHVHVLNHEKNCIKKDFKGISLKFATNG